MAFVSRLLSTLGVALTLVAALALAAAGGAHRVGTVDQAQAAKAAIAAVYGGSAQICGDDHGKGALPADCPVCHVAGAALLPEPATGALAAELRFAADVILPEAQRAPARPGDPVRSPRGPPTI